MASKLTKSESERLLELETSPAELTNAQGAELKRLQDKQVGGTDSKIQGEDKPVDATSGSATEGVQPSQDDNTNPNATYAPQATPQERTEFAELAKTYGGEVDVTVDHNGTPGLTPEGTPILLDPQRPGERVAEVEQAKFEQAQKDGKPYTNFATGQTIENEKKTA